MKPISSLEEAILNTIAYGDIFNYPLTPAEIYRYLIGAPASPASIQDALQSSHRLAGLISQYGPYYMLRGREELAYTRYTRSVVAAGLWSKAIHYGRLISQMPFVRMVAVTGSLAMNNPDRTADIDFLVVTKAGRLWLARALVILLVRLAARQGVRICPNYFLSERALLLKDQNIYAAHELAHMVPLSGREVYARMREVNGWVYPYLPNAKGAPNVAIQADGTHSWIKALGEALVANRVGGWLESWEMGRKLQKFYPLALQHPEASFGPDWCKGHIDDHEEHTLSIYQELLESLELQSLDLQPLERAAV